MEKQENNLMLGGRLIAYHQRMICEGVADVDVLIKAVNLLGPKYDLEIVDSVFWSLQTLAGSASTSQVAFPVQKLAELKAFLDANFISNNEGKIIRL